MKSYFLIVDIGDAANISWKTSPQSETSSYIEFWFLHALVCIQTREVLYVHKEK